MIVDYRLAGQEDEALCRALWEGAGGGALPAGFFSGARTELAFTDGEAVGLSVAEPLGVDLRPAASHACHLRVSLAVGPDCRGCGVGRALLRRLIEYASKRHYDSVLVLDLSVRQREGRALLEDEGFRRVGRLICAAGDVWMYQRILK